MSAVFRLFSLSRNFPVLRKAGKRLAQENATRSKHSALFLLKLLFTMPRKLKYHEQKLLKKVDLYVYPKEHNLREIEVMRRYHVQNREDYLKYNKLCGYMRSLTAALEKLPADDAIRVKMTEQLLEKIYNIGLIPTKKSLQQVEGITASSFCRRRLPVVLVRLKFAETLKEAVTFVEQGHIRVGPNTVTDPAFLVTRNMEDFITWVDTSKIKRTVMRYNDLLDDYELLS